MDAEWNEKWVMASFSVDCAGLKSEGESKSSGVKMMGRNKCAFARDFCWTKR
jgi:hypothetical protein